MMAIVTLILSDGKEIQHLFACMPQRIGTETTLEMSLKNPTPRFFFTHLPFELLKGCFNNRPKIIYLMRNPFDQLVSCYNFYKMYKPFGLYTSSWDDFFADLYEKDNMFYGNNLDHVVGWWNVRDDHKDHILCVKYEDMIKDLRAIILQVASFLGRQLSEEVVLSILEQTTFANMQKNPVTNQTNNTENDNDGPSKFFRKGITGDWENYFDETQKSQVEQELENKLGNLGLHFDTGA